jgi:hypothetical protein
VVVARSEPDLASHDLVPVQRRHRRRASCGAGVGFIGAPGTCHPLHPPHTMLDGSFRAIRGCPAGSGSSSISLLGSPASCRLVRQSSVARSVVWPSPTWRSPPRLEQLKADVRWAAECPFEHPPHLDTGACRSNGPRCAHGACEPQPRSEEEVDPSGRQRRAMQCEAATLMRPKGSERRGAECVVATPLIAKLVSPPWNR